VHNLILSVRMFQDLMMHFSAAQHHIYIIRFKYYRLIFIIYCADVLNDTELKESDIFANFRIYFTTRNVNFDVVINNVLRRITKIIIRSALL